MSGIHVSDLAILIFGRSQRPIVQNNQLRMNG